uniref:Gag-like protein n=1 Tax=Cacopsylla melanoneura TaxID=428564 RepID=A0A8D8WZC2_9HEMI
MGKGDKGRGQRSSSASKSKHDNRTPPGSRNQKQPPDNKSRFLRSNLQASIFSDDENNVTNSVPTKNRFDILTTIDESHAKVMNTDPPTKVTSSRKDTSPIIIEKYLGTMSQITAELKEICSSNFTLKYVGTDGLTIRTRTSEDYEKTVTLLQHKDISFHTYTPPSRKLTSFVVKGLHPSYTEEEILSEIQETLPQATSIHCMRTKNKETYPIYIVKFKDNIKLLETQRLNFIFQLRVYWSKYQPLNKRTQCYRCQDYGHGQRTETSPYQRHAT